MNTEAPDDISPEACDAQAAEPLDSKAYVKTSLVVPDIVDRMLPVRRSVLAYEASNMLASGPRRGVDEGPETRYSKSSKEVALPRRFIPVYAYPFGGNGMLTCAVIDKERHRTISGFWDSVRDVRAAWVMKGMKPEVRNDLKTHNAVARLYAEPPLHFFTSVAEREMEMIDPRHTEFRWDAIYTGSMTVSARDNLMGLIQDNCVVDMRHYETDAEHSVKSSPERRKYMDCWDGFIDRGFTTAGPDAGNVMAMVHGVQIRVLDDVLWSKTRDLLVGLCAPSAPESPRDWVMYFYGAVKYVSYRQVEAAIDMWRKMTGFRTPSIHVHESSKIVVLAATSGCLMRPLQLRSLECANSEVGDVDPDKGLWVDSYVFNSDTQRKSLGLSCARPSDPLEYARTHAWLFPYFLMDEQPRPMLGSIMASQAIAFGSTSIASTISPVACTAPKVVTPLGNLISQSCPADKCILPGIDLIVAFINLRGTYEDSVIVSSEIETLESAKATGSVNHPVPNFERRDLTGATITGESHRWWRPSRPGHGVQTGYTNTRDPYVKASISQSGLVPGDKIATSHGQKQTVSAVLSRDQMPTCYDVKRNKTFKPHIIMASSSVSNRMTAGQIYEARAGASVVDVERYLETVGNSTYVTDVLGLDFRSLEPTTCQFTELGDGDNKALVLDDSGSPCTADYGVIRVWQLGHVARDKQQFSSEVPRGMSAPAGRLSGSSVRVGEMELIALLSKGMIACASEMLDCSDMAVVTLCSACRRLSILCDCKPGCVETMRAELRYSVVRADVCTAIYSLGLSGYVRSTSSSPRAPKPDLGTSSSPKATRADAYGRRSSDDAIGEAGHRKRRGPEVKMPPSSFVYDFQIP